MCKEINHFSNKKKPVSSHSHPLGEREQALNQVSKSTNEVTEHQHHDDAAHLAHQAEARSSEPHDHHDHPHHLHDDVISLAHRTHDHQNPPLMHNHAQARATSCHDGDGHDHGSSSLGIIIGGTPIKPSGGGGGAVHSHDHGKDVAHCPKCDEHMEGENCQKCGYKKTD